MVMSMDLKGGTAASVDHTNYRRQRINWYWLTMEMYASSWLAAWHMPVQ